jgi:large subunit ribosomal protein L6e
MIYRILKTIYYIEIIQGGKEPWKLNSNRIMVKKFKWYPAEDEKKPFTRKSKAKKHPMKARKGLETGAVCIVLSGRFQGRRVVFLKMLPSGLALVTGPYKVNGVPLRRMNPAYLLVTSTKIPVQGKEHETVDDKFFAKAKEAKKPEEEKFFAEAGAQVFPFYNHPHNIG